MRIRYYLSTKSRLDGRYYVHSEWCPFLPSVGSRIFLGKFPSPEEAEKASKMYRTNASFCKYCMKEHTEKGNRTAHAELAKREDLISSGIIKEIRDSMFFCGIN